VLQKLSIVVVIIAAFAASVFSQTSEFTYQGSLKDGAAPANGNYDFEFRLYDALSGGSQIGPLVTRANVVVSDGLFSVKLDFSGAISPFPGADRFLQVSVRNTGGGAYTMLDPRQKVGSSPYSIKSATSTSADSLSAACTLCVTDSQIISIAGSKVTGSVANATTATTVTGIVQIANGGTGSPTKNFVDLTTDQTSIGGNKTFTGVLSGNGSGLTNVSATIADGSVTTSKIADGAVTEEKLSVGLVNSPQRNLALLGSLRWDLLKGEADFTAGSGPRGVAFDGANIWVTNQSSNNVTKLRASDGANLGTFSVGTGPIGIAFDGANMWVMNGTSGNLTKLRASDGANLGTVPSVFGFDVIFDGANIWVASNNGGMVGKYRASDGANLGFFAAGSFPRGLAFDGANIWITNQNDGLVRRIRASDGTLVGGLITVGTGPIAIAFDGANVWVVNSSGNSVSKVRAVDGSVQGTFAVGTSPRGIAFDGTNMWVTNSSSITKLRASDGANLGTFSLTGPQGIAFDGMNMWVTSTSNVRRLLPAFP
jgi:hypothetical protein